MSYEKAVPEFRQIKCPIRGLVLSVQQKWLVHFGTPYSPAGFGPPDRKEDAFMGIIDGLPMWHPVKVEWRDLPVAEQESTT